MSDDDRATWEDWLDAIEKDGVNLSVWEDTFISSIRRQLAMGRTLSEKQADILERIYAENTP